MEMIVKGKWKDASGRLINPGKYFLLILAAKAVRDFKNQRDEHGINYTNKEMILLAWISTRKDSGNLISSLQN